jgi:ADP-heptose:LPS heptosyltransferase
MMQQVLIINITRMGDLAQTVPLLGRLAEEWPGVAIDLVIDTRLAPMAALLPGLRHIHTYDIKTVSKNSQSGPRGDESLSPDIAAWAQSLAAVGYDRVINLTFTHWSGLLAAAIGAPDTRGAATTKGISILKNPWLAYCVDMHQFRRFNRFNVADLFALGGSGLGSHQPIRFTVPSQAVEWARARVAAYRRLSLPLVAVQVTTSKTKKAWRPEYVGQTMAALSRQTPCVFVLTGTANDAADVAVAVTAYQAAGGVSELCNMVGQTGVHQLAALLKECRLVLASDTGPMHLAVGVGTAVINISVGHVDFRETGPYGPGHWVVQPLLDCAPCDMAEACAHHRCKELVVPEQVAKLARHVLGLAPFPECWTGVRVYQSAIDADGFVCYQQRAGQCDAMTEWYGTFWRRFWYEQFTGHTSRIAFEPTPPDLAEQQEQFCQLALQVDHVVQHAECLAILCHQPTVSAGDLRAAQDKLIAARQAAMPTTMASPAFGSITTALFRDLYDGRVLDTRTRADHQAQAYRTWKTRIYEVRDRLDQAQGRSGARCSPVRLRLPMVEVELGREKVSGTIV